MYCKIRISMNSTLSSRLPKKSVRITSRKVLPGNWSSRNPPNGERLIQIYGNEQYVLLQEVVDTPFSNESSTLPRVAANSP